jgi:hypothetical protein
MDHLKPTREAISGHMKLMLLENLGRENAVKRDALLARLKAIDARISDRDMRKAIEKYLPETCMCARGYFFPKTDKEINRTVDYIEAKIRGLAQRRRAILETYPSMGAGRQMRLGI